MAVKKPSCIGVQMASKLQIKNDIVVAAHYTKVLSVARNEM